MLQNLETVRQTLTPVTDRFAQFEAQALDVHVDLSGSSKIPGIKIHDTRMLRPMPQSYTLTQLRYDLRNLGGFGGNASQRLSLYGVSWITARSSG